MTPTPTNDLDRARIIHATNQRTAAFTRDPISKLRERVSAKQNDGQRGARWDGDPGSKGKWSPSDGSPVETQALGPHLADCDIDEHGNCACPDKRSDKATNDLATIDRALSLYAQANKLIEQVVTDNPPDTTVAPVCPPGKCVGHFAAGITIAAQKAGKGSSGQRRRCRTCDDFYRQHGEDMPPLVILTARTIKTVLADQHGREPTKAEVWSHPRVLRAWDTSGWVTKPELRKRSA